VTVIKKTFKVEGYEKILCSGEQKHTSHMIRNKI